MDDYLTQKSLWFYRNVLDPESEGILTQKDFDRSAFKYAILYCKGDKIKEFCEMFLNVFREFWNSIKSCSTIQSDRINFLEFRMLITSLSQQCKSYEELPPFLQKLIDMLFESYDSKGDNGIDVDEYRLYLCARNMDVRKATDCFLFMTGVKFLTNQSLYDYFQLIFFYIYTYFGDIKTKIKKPQFRVLMFDFMTSRDPNTKGRYICGPFDSVHKETLSQYFKLATRKVL